MTRTLKVDDQEVTEYYHRGVVCHLIGQELAIPLDVEFQRPGEGEVPAAKRLLERVFANYPRYFEAVVGDGLYFEAPFINFCQEHHKDVVVVVNSTSTHWGLDHVFKHEPTAIVNFVLTLFLAFVLLQCFWQRNLKSPLRERLTLIGLAAELYLGLVASQGRRACCASDARGP